MRSLLQGVLVSSALVATLAFSSTARAQASGNPGDLQAGGLTPPGAGTGPTAPPPTGPSETERQLSESDQKDSGRGLEFVYLNVEGGMQYVSLQSLSTGGGAGVIPTGVSTVKTSDIGPMAGVGAGLRLVFLTVGPRFRIGHFSDWDVWTLNGEVGIHIPLGSVEPYITLGAGYAKLGNAAKAQANISSDSGVKVGGYDVRAGFGIDYYVTNTFTIGANVTGEAMMMTRPGVSASSIAGAQGSAQASAAKCNDPTITPPAQQQTCLQGVATAQAYQLDGSSVGIAATGSIVLGLHF